MSDSPPVLPSPDDPDFLVAVCGLYKASRMLFTSISVGLFTALAKGPLTMEELAAAIQIPLRSVHVLAHAMLALRVLEKKDGKLSNGPVAQAQLTGSGPEDMRAGVRLYEMVNYPLWEQFENTVRTGQPARTTKPSPEFAKIFSEGVEAFTRPAVTALLKAYDFGKHQRILDLAGGTGSYLLPILRQHSSLAATLYELPHVADMARRRLSADPAGARVEVVEGDALFDPIPSGHDVVLLANTVHLLGPEKVQLLFKRTRESVAPGTRLVMPEHWMDSTYTRPPFLALLSGTFLLLSGDGSTYSVEDASGWLQAAGWRMLEHRPLHGLISLVIAEAA